MTCSPGGPAQPRRTSDTTLRPAAGAGAGPLDPPVSPPEGADPKRWRALAVSQLAAFMSLLDVSIVNVALPSIERDLGASAGSVQWVVSGYALTLGFALVPAGSATRWAGGECS